MDSFQQGLMTGAQLGGRMRQNRQNREIGGLMSSGDYAGASAAAYGAGDIAAGQGIERIGQQQQAQQRQQGVGTALAGGDYNAATTAAGGDVDLLNTIRQFRESASAAEVRQAAQRAENFAQIGLQLLEVKDPVQRRQQALALAQREGIPPDQIPENLTDEMLTGWYRSNMSAAELLAERKDARDATRPIVTPYGIMLPPGATGPNISGQQPQSLGSTLPPGWSPVNPNQAPSASASGGAERNQPVSVRLGSPVEARSKIQSIVPGVTFTSGTRSPEKNRQVGGAPGSFHTQGRAWDLVPPRGMTMAQLAQKMRQEGFRALDEGDHVHVSW